MISAFYFQEPAMKNLSFYFGILVLAFSSSISLAQIATDTRCRVECKDPQSNCVHLGEEARPAALHLNEMINAARSEQTIRWDRSSCLRRLVNDGITLETSGPDCVEERGPLKISFLGDMIGFLEPEEDFTDVTFGFPYPILEFTVNGELGKSEPVNRISRAVPGQLLIDTDPVCYSIE
jgi:hypothetical protein